MKNSFKKTLSVCSAIALLAASAQAAFLAPNTSAVLGAGSPVGGAIVGGPLISPFAGAAFSGTVTSTVFTADPFNPFGAAALTFVYQVANAAASTDSLSRFTVIGWAGPVLDADNVIPLTGNPARYTDRSLSGDTVGFTWFDAPIGFGTILPGTVSTVVIHTPLTTFVTSVGNVIDGGVASMPVYAAVPEPTTIIAGALLLLPFGASAARILRRKV